MHPSHYHVVEEIEVEKQDSIALDSVKNIIHNLRKNKMIALSSFEFEFASSVADSRLMAILLISSCPSMVLMFIVL